MKISKDLYEARKRQWTRLQLSILPNIRKSREKLESLNGDFMLARERKLKKDLLTRLDDLMIDLKMFQTELIDWKP